MPQRNIRSNILGQVTFDLEIHNSLDLLDCLKNYATAESVTDEYVMALKKMLKSGKRVESGFAKISHLGIMHPLFKLEIPDARIPQISQKHFEYKGVKFLPFETLKLIKIILTEHSIESENDYRLDFIKIFVSDFKFEVEKIPDPKTTLREETNFNNIKKRIPIYLLFMAIGHVFILTSMPYTNQTDLRHLSIFLAPVAVLLPLLSFFIHFIFSYRLRSNRIKLYISHVLRGVEPGEKKDGWAIDLRLPDIKKTNTVAQTLFRDFLTYGFSWDTFNVENGHIRGIISSENKINRHKWGYLYPILCDLGDLSEDEEVSGKNSERFIAQLLSSFVSRTFVYKKGLVVAMTYIPHYILKVDHSYNPPEKTTQFLSNETLSKHIAEYKKVFVIGDVHIKDLGQEEMINIHSDRHQKYQLIATQETTQKI